MCTQVDHELLKRSSSWPALVAETKLKPWVVSPGMHLEMANCPECNSTISVEVRTIPACRHCNGEGLVLDEREREVECGFCSGSGDATQAVAL